MGGLIKKLTEKESIEIDALVKPLIELLKSLENEHYNRMHVVLTKYLSKVPNMQLYINNVSEIYEEVYRSNSANDVDKGDFCSAFAKVVQEESGKDVEITIKGGAWDGIGRLNQESVVVRVSGDAGNSVGYNQKSGVIYIGGDAEDYVGFNQGGGEIHIGGDSGVNAGLNQIGGELHIAGSVKSFYISAFDITSNKEGKIHLGDGKGGEVLIYDGSQATTMVLGDGNISLTEEAWDKFDVNIGTYIDQVIITPKT